VDAQPPVDYAEYPRGSGPDDLSKLRGALAATTRLNQAAAAYIALTVLSLASRGALPGEVNLGLSIAGLVAFLVLAAIASRDAARVLGKNEILAILGTVLLTCVPCGVLILLVSRQSQMAKVIKPYGIRIGFLGPNAEDVRRVLGQ
jgi:hypothetical protein